jgi:hypothetical protein
MIVLIILRTGGIGLANRPPENCRKTFQIDVTDTGSYRYRFESTDKKIWHDAC